MNKLTIPKTSVIELRQQNKNSKVLENGDFAVNLDQQLILEEGDSLQLKSVYLDTGSVESGYIDLPPDDTQADPANPITTITITVGKYLMNVPSSQEGEFYTTNIADKPVVQSKIRNPQFTDGVEQTNGRGDRIRANTDGKPYVMCTQTQNSGAADTIFQVVAFPVVFIGSPKGDLAAANLALEITYFPTNNPTNPKKVPFGISIKGPLTTPTMIADFFSRFDGNGLRVTQDLIEDFPEIFYGTGNLDFMSGFASGTANGPTSTRVNFNGQPFPYAVALAPPETVAVNPNQLHLSPVLEDIVITLPAARYTSSELAQRITREASRINQLGDMENEAFSSTNSVMYRTIQDELQRINPNFVPSVNDATAHALLTNGKIVFVETDIPAGQTYRETFRLNSYKTTDLNYMVGSAGGFTLEYDEASEKFSIGNIHSPLRDQNPDGHAIGSPQVRGYCQGLMNADGLALNQNRKFYVNKYSGVYIQNLKPESVWHTQMKFNRNLYPNSTNSKQKYKIGKPPTGGADNREEFSMDSDLMVLNDGEHITGTYEGVATAEQHGISQVIVGGGGAGANSPRIGAGTSTFDTVINFLPLTTAAQNVTTESITPVPYLASNTDQVFNIFSNQQVEDGNHDVADEGYYKIVVDSKIDNELVGADSTIRNVSAIISKFNSYGNFTAAYNEGSVSYIHKGQPLTITDFRVKILLPSGEIASDINDRNTVFLELTKNQ